MFAKITNNKCQNVLAQLNHSQNRDTFKGSLKSPLLAEISRNADEETTYCIVFNTAFSKRLKKWFRIIKLLLTHRLSK